MGKFFGTDGVRGVANIELTPELVPYCQDNSRYGHENFRRYA